jgi:hypothetical protein
MRTYSCRLKIFRKSLTMDIWTREQVEVREFHQRQGVRHVNLVLSQHMRRVGNINSNEMYNPNEVRHPPPANMIDVARDSEIEKFIRGR